MEMLVILTVQDARGVIASLSRTVTFDAGSTRGGVFNWAMGQLRNEGFHGSTVLFFSAEHSQLAPPVPEHTAAARDGQP